MKDKVTYQSLSFRDVYCYQSVGFSSIFFDLDTKPFFRRDVIILC